jgi:hypothetical protein
MTMSQLSIDMERLKEEQPPDDQGDNLPLVRASIPGAPRQIEVYIGKLVLHGFSQTDRWQVCDTFRHELGGLLAAQGVPRAWFSNPERIAVDTVRPLSLIKSAQAGAEIAGAVHRGGSK